jgi:hypothetical protein
MVLAEIKQVLACYAGKARGEFLPFCQVLSGVIRNVEMKFFGHKNPHAISIALKRFH